MATHQTHTIETMETSMRQGNSLKICMVHKIDRNNHCLQTDMGTSMTDSTTYIDRPTCTHASAVVTRSRATT